MVSLSANDSSPPTPNTGDPCGCSGVWTRSASDVWSGDVTFVASLPTLSTTTGGQKDVRVDRTYTWDCSQEGVTPPAPVPLFAEATYKVKCPTGVAPPKGCVGFAHSVTISGKGFTSPVSVEVSGGGVTVSDETFVDDETITATFIIDVAAQGGKRDVTVNGCVGKELFKVQRPEQIAETAKGVANDGTSGSFSYQVQDQDGEAIAQAGMTAMESFAGTATIFKKANCDAQWNCGDPLGPPVAFQQADPQVIVNTDAAGKFTDTPVGRPPADLVNDRAAAGFDVVVKTQMTKLYYTRITQGSSTILFPLKPEWLQSICQTAVDDNGTINTGNCGVDESPLPP